MKLHATTLESLEFKRCLTDPTIFTRKHDTILLKVAVYTWTTFCSGITSRQKNRGPASGYILERV